MIADLFAGPGGWDEGLRYLTTEPVVGLEKDKAACATRAKAGHLTIRADVSNYPLDPFEGITGLMASPPCQSFSQAGRRKGLADLRGQLIFQALRWADELRPQWVACEQVEGALPIWKMFADEMRGWGYSVWYGLLNCADYGVPQTRVRAVMMASQEPFRAPEPTHAKNPSEDIFGSTFSKWITMAEALGWGITDEPAGPVMSRGHDEQGKATGGPRPLDGGSGGRERYRRAMREGRWVDPDAPNAPESLLPPEGSRIRGGLPTKHHKPTERTLDEPAPTLAFGNDAAGWAWERPATTVVGSFQPQIIAAPGWRTEAKDSRQYAEGSIPVSYRQAGVLQTFPHDYPWQGSKTKKFEQIGNAIPPLLAYHVLKNLLEVNP